MIFYCFNMLISKINYKHYIFLCDLLHFLVWFIFKIKHFKKQRWWRITTTNVILQNEMGLRHVLILYLSRNKNEQYEFFFVYIKAAQNSSIPSAPIAFTRSLRERVLVS